MLSYKFYFSSHGIRDDFANPVTHIYKIIIVATPGVDEPWEMNHSGLASFMLT